MDPMIGMIFVVPFNWAPYNYNFCQGQTLSIQQYTALYSLIGTTYGGNASTNFILPDLRSRVPVGATAQSGGTPYTLGKTLGMETTTLSIGNMPVHSHSAAFQPTTGSQKVTIPATIGNLGVTATPNLTYSGNANLPVTASAKIGTTNTAGRNQNISDNALITSTPISNSAIYAPAANGATTVIGPLGAVTGTATGTVTGAVSGTITTTITGNASTAATVADINTVTGGSVTVGSTGGSMAFTNLQPSLVLNFVIALNGLYPDRP